MLQPLLVVTCVLRTAWRQRAGQPKAMAPSFLVGVSLSRSLSVSRSIQEPAAQLSARGVTGGE